MNSIAIIGLGLIGGSIAKAVKNNSDIKVIGFDIDDETLFAAKELGAIDKAWDGHSILVADLIVLAMSPSATIEFLKTKIDSIDKNAVITDVCGVKAAIVSDCIPLCSEHGLEFVGSHPMAGKEFNGFKNSDANLFYNASYIITPVQGTKPQAIDIIKELGRILKFRKLTVTTPENHDRMIAFTSQLPHVLAGSYVRLPPCSEHEGYSAGSYNDVSRVATIDENLWSELFLLNKEEICSEIRGLISNLSEYLVAIENNDKEELKGIIKSGRLIKERDIK
ncbi:MAG: prephenate dehydrogenase [Oscillospiraceae bacterium]|nr:prephenate dehydrogenase [Oscillospiraceae bacterium]